MEYRFSDYQKKEIFPAEQNGLEVVHMTFKEINTSRPAT